MRARHGSRHVPRRSAGSGVCGLLWIEHRRQTGPLGELHGMPRITFVELDGTRRDVEAPVGLSLLEVAHQNDIDLEGACEGSLACSTCHVVVDPTWFNRLEPIEEDEEDMLDLAFGIEKTSRLGCQIIVTEELDGLTVRLPTGTNNMMG